LDLTFDTIRLYPALFDSAVGDGGVDSLRHGGRHGPGGGPGHGPGHVPGEGPGPCDPDSGRNYVEILTDPVTVDVVALGTELSRLIGAAAVPAGDYGHLSLRVVAASALTDSGATVPVTVASRDSLLRVMSRFTVVEGQETEIPVVIDLDRSVREVPPGSGNLVLRPVLFGGEPRGPGGGSGVDSTGVPPNPPPDGGFGGPPPPGGGPGGPPPDGDPGRH